MRQSSFYILEQHPVDTTDAETEFFSLKPDNTGDAPRCPTCGDYIGMCRWLPPYQVELKLWGWHFGDIAYGAGLNVLVSERFRALYEEHELVGLTGFEPVRRTRAHTT